jgi:hypothetical protein
MGKKKTRMSTRGDAASLYTFGGPMDIMLAIVVVVLPSALAVVWLAWHSGSFDITRQR